ncbi:MAG: HAD hydrolase-like protein [Actinomycetota bacterium]|nr:HAD hydrolase-like protein [Actinomycetota bacterium]
MGSPEGVAEVSQLPRASAILLDAGGVLVFPEPDRILAPLRAAGFHPDLATLERAHYQAMAVQDAAALPPVQDTWWRDYLLTFIAACGVPGDRCEELAAAIDHGVRGYSWSHVGLGAIDGLRAVAALGLPMGVVSNSDGTVESYLRRLGVCYALQRPGPPADPDAPHRPEPPAEHPGVRVGVVIDSAVVGVAKPDPAIFGLALDALDVPPGRTVVHVGDSLRYDVAGALAAGLQPVHLDPYGFCPQPDGHPHVRSLAELPPLIGG